mgnify:CR=1 FL=1
MQLKQSKHLSDLKPGAIVWLHENGKFILFMKHDYNSGLYWYVYLTTGDIRTSTDARIDIAGVMLEIA